MKKLTMIAGVAALGLVMGACTPREERVASGALLGAAAGGLIGAAARVVAAARWPARRSAPWAAR